jgi:hypothetical protein
MPLLLLSFVAYMFKESKEISYKIDLMKSGQGKHEHTFFPTNHHFTYFTPLTSVATYILCFLPSTSFLCLSLSLLCRFAVGDDGREACKVARWGSRWLPCLPLPAWAPSLTYLQSYSALSLTPGAHPVLRTWGLFARGRSGRGVNLTTHRLAPRSGKCRRVHLLPIDLQRLVLN